MEEAGGERDTEDTEIFSVLYLRQVKHLARHLGTTIDDLERVTESIPRYCEELELTDPARPDKVRTVLNVVGRLRKLQDKLLRCVLLPKLTPSFYSHGGVVGRHIKSNVTAHIASGFALVTDLANFYPSVSHCRVYRLFVKDFGCTADVARLCTQLCTYKYHLALGLPTSPILADQILRSVDRRIGAACEGLGLVYTRFVDDLTVSAAFDLAPRSCGISALIERVLSEHGLAINAGKSRWGRLDDGFPITNIRVHHGHLDVRAHYFEELNRQLEDAASLARGGEFRGPYFTQAQIAGRVRFVCWVNPGRKRLLVPKLKSVPWNDVEAEARRRRYVVAKKQLRPLGP